MRKKTKWRIQLGEAEWRRYTHDRQEDEGLKLLGSVRCGAQLGALGRTAQGEYVQVVGDFVITLNRSQLAKAIAKATSKDTYQHVQPVQNQTRAPVVVIKRRRIPVTA